MKCKSIFTALAIAALLWPAGAFADTIGSVEGARSKERQGRWLDRQDREQLRRWGGNDDYRGYRYYRPRAYYDDGYDYDYGPRGYGPGVGIYIDP